MKSKVLQKTTPFPSVDKTGTTQRTIYYGEVISIKDETDGGRIKVRILGLDNNTHNENLPWAYPLIPKFIHLFPKVGEMVRVFIEDLKYPQKSRFWLGSIISQPHLMKFDSKYTALSTTNMGTTRPEKAPSTFPDAKGVFPDKEDIGLIGRENTDVVLKPKTIVIRTGKHEPDNPLRLNKKNPAIFQQKYYIKNDDWTTETVVLSDKIALLSHKGNPKFKSHTLSTDDFERIFNEGRPLARGDVLVRILDVMRKAIIGHIHGYSSLEADKNDIINELEKLNIESLLQKNVVTN